MTPAMRTILLGDRWTPLALGSSLFAWWDAERADLVTQSGSAVSSWRDIVGGNDAVQATGAAQPAYGAGSFGGRPGITFDGSDDRLRVAVVPAAIPTGTAAVWLWGLASQDVDGADGFIRDLVGYGDAAATANTRRVSRIRNSNLNRSQALAGDGAVGCVSQELTVDLSGRHVLLGKIGSTATVIVVDGMSGTPVAAVPATNASNFTIGGAPNGGQFWRGAINSILVTAPLSAADEARVLTFLSLRR